MKSKRRNNKDTKQIEELHMLSKGENIMCNLNSSFFGFFVKALVHCCHVWLISHSWNRPYGNKISQVVMGLYVTDVNSLL
jgi:hypothetical protein